MKFSQEIISVLDYLGQKFGIAVDWTSENVVPYLKDLCARYISYEVMTSIAWMAMVLVLTIIIVIPLPILHKKAKELHYNDCYGTVIAAIIFWVLFVCMSVVSIGVIGTQVFDIIECHTLPEKVISEYLETLVNSAK